MATKINYVVGDATDPCTPDGRKFIMHICNDKGEWGAGFVMAISKKWAEPERAYRNWYAGNDDEACVAGVPFELGESQITIADISSGSDGSGIIYVVNMIAQEAYSKPGKPAVKYDMLEKCFNGFVKWFNSYGSIEDSKKTIHLPYIGCGLGGGKWSEIEPIIERTLCKNNMDVYVYDLPNTQGETNV